MGNCWGHDDIPITKTEEIKKHITLVNWSIAMAEDVEETDYTGMKMFVRIVDIYDGDTFTCVFWDPYMNRWNSKRCRLLGIDAPEIRPRKNIPNRSAKIDEAYAAKEMLSGWVNEHGHFLIAETEAKRDKYGRLLVDVYKFKIEGEILDLDHYHLDRGRSLSQFMLANAPCREYDGGTK